MMILKDMTSVISSHSWNDTWGWIYSHLKEELELIIELIIESAAFSHTVPSLIWGIKATISIYC